MVEAILDLIGLAEVLAVVAGLVLGIVIGAIPGMGPFLGVILAIPFTYAMDPVTGMALLLGIYQGGSYGGAVSATLLGIPGTPIAAATLLDAHPMAKTGRASEAITLATLASCVGGIIGGIILVFAAPFLAQIALRFGPAEIFALAFLGLTAIAALSTEGSLAKGLISGLFGLLIATIGNDPISGLRRFTFDITALDGGISIVAVLMGIFALPEVAFQIEQRGLHRQVIDRVSPAWATFRTLVTAPFTYLRSATVGIVIGVIPGVGGPISSFLAYQFSRDLAKDKTQFGKGAPQGIISSEAANSATTGGTMIPMLAVGIPGDPIVAVLMGGLMIQGLTPGPLMFLTNADVVSGIFAVFLLGAVLLLPIGLLLLPAFVRLLKVNVGVLMGGVVLCSVLGVYAVQRQVSDLWVMAAFGVLGYAMRKFGYPLAPLVIGLVLGPIFESNFRRTMIMGQGDLFSVLLERPIAATIIAAALALLVWQIWIGLRRRFT